MTTSEVLTAVAEGRITPTEGSTLLAELAKEQGKKKLKLKVSSKGAVQLDGLRRFPVTLYKDEWEQVLGLGDEIRKFIKENDKVLTSKADAKGE